MANNTKEIKRRIKSITNIGQITKAMELVSAAKMRKAQAAAVASRPYATMSVELLRQLAGKTDLSAHPLIMRSVPAGKKIAIDKTLIILISSDRGLAGAFNSNVIAKAMGIAKAESASAKASADRGAPNVDFITVGKKGSDAVSRLGYNIVATFPGKDKSINLLDAKPVVQIAVADYLNYKYGKVFVVYTNFISTLVQKANILQLLPFVEEPASAKASAGEEFIFEPSADDVLDTLITRTIEFAVFQALVEVAASEHSARMVAMRNANEAAGDLIQDLSLTYNQARQAGITRELSEISAAKLAMEE